MYNLLEYSKNYKKTTSDPLSTNSESIKYKTSITENTYNIGDGEAGYDATKLVKMKLKLLFHENI